MMCYQCGKRKATIEGLCEPCFLEGKPPLLVKNLKIRVCKECGAIYFNSWRDITLEDVIKEYINVEDTDFSIEEKQHTYNVTVVARQMFHQNQTHPLVQQAQFSVYVKDSLCDHCSKMHAGYYEAVLQVRRQTHILTDEEREMCFNTVMDSLRTEDFISRIQERKEGTDFYFSSTKAAKRAADLLKKRMGGKIKESYHIMGFDRQKSTDIKRGTVLFQLHRYKEGDIVLVQERVYLVKSAAQKLHIKNAETEKVLPWKQVEHLENRDQISIIPPERYDFCTCQVLDVTPSSVLIMRPDFSTIYLERPKDIKVDIGKNYRILFFDEYAYWM